MNKFKVLLSTKNGDHVMYIESDSWSAVSGRYVFQNKDDGTDGIATIDASAVVAISKAENANILPLAGANIEIR